MRRRLETTVEGRRVAVDGRDVAAWARRSWPPSSDAAGEWPVLAEEYVHAHPRPAGSGGMASGQRLALLRRLAAGPATRVQLLAVLRTLGWVAADDLENRLRDLRSADSRAGAAQAGLPVRSEGDRYWLAEPFADLDEADRRALGFAKAMVDRVDGPLAEEASAALERLLPGLATGSGQRVPARYRASAADLQRFNAALADRRAVRVRYFSLNSGRERTYDLVPIEYATIGTTVKAVCVAVDTAGRRVGDDRQFAMDRLLAVTELEGRPPPEPEELQLHRVRLVLHVSDGLYQVMRQRNLFGIAEGTAQQDPTDDSWRIAGSFPVALAWDVMEQLCAWAGNAQVHEPLWLVSAVCRRLRAGLRVMQEGADFELVKPEPLRTFGSHGEAVTADGAEPRPQGPRKLAPR